MEQNTLEASPSNEKASPQANPDATVTQTRDEERDGSHAIGAALQASGVEIVFGYAGGAVPSLIRGVTAHDIPVFSGRTELSAAWMSYGYNRAKRRAASAVVTHHVGALHAAPAIYGSTMDGNPLLFMTMDNPPAMEARDGLQDAVEVYPSLKPLSKYIKKVNDAADLPVIVRQAVKAASTGKFGSSVLVLPQTVMYQKTTMRVEPLVLPDRPSPSEKQIAATWAHIKSAARPVLYIGAGVHLADAAVELRRFAELTGIPVVSTSWGGRGVLPDAHELYIGASGNFGWKSANEALQLADFWLTLGSSFSQMSTGSWSLKKPDTVVQVDVNEYELAKIFQPTLAVQADAKYFLQALIEHAHRDADLKRLDWSDWAKQALALKVDFKAEMASWAVASEVPLNQYHVINVLAEELPTGTLVIGDSGSNAFALYRAFEYKQTTAQPTGGHYMSLGAGLPVAIGAKLADPSKTVVAYHGDGGFYYDMAELSILTERKLKVIVIIDNNGCLLANRSAMKAMGMDNPWADLPDTTDFVAIAKGMGVDGECVRKSEDLAPAIQRALAAKDSYLIDVRTTPGLRIRRALTNIIPVVGDRTPKSGHLETVLDGSWPS